MLNQIRILVTVNSACTKIKTYVKNFKILKITFKKLKITFQYLNNMEQKKVYITTGGTITFTTQRRSLFHISGKVPREKCSRLPAKPRGNLFNILVSTVNCNNWSKILRVIMQHHGESYTPNTGTQQLCN